MYENVNITWIYDEAWMPLNLGEGITAIAAALAPTPSSGVIVLY